MKKSSKSKAMRVAVSLATLGGVGALSAIAATSASASTLTATGAAPAVYTSTNATTGNAVQVFLRQADGSLIAGQSYSTGGTGSGAIGSQGAVTLSANGKSLLVVNSGSNQISDFAVGPDGTLQLINVIGSGGVDPISVAIRGNLVEVLNAGSPNVAGFVNTKAGLVEIANGSQPLSANASGAEDVTINPSGTQVVVTEKVSDTIDTFAVGNGDSLAPAVNTLNNGPASYASVFVRGQLLVADAGGAGTSAVSAYTVNADSTLNASEPPLVNGQTAACWIAANPRGEVFVANAGSPSISTYRVLPDGALGLFGNTALPVGVKPLDTAASTDGQDVYVIDAANHAIDAFAVGTNGQLSPVGQPTSIPAGAVGLAAS